jgi:hypothetical protein
MSQNRPSAFSSLRMGGKYLNPSCACRLLTPPIEVIREKVQDGQTGEYKDLAYTQCKIVGNGSFGVVFQTKLSPSGEDAAIKRVLQDKRFKVGLHRRSENATTQALTRSRIVNCRSCASSGIQTLSNSRHSSTTMASGYVSTSMRTRGICATNIFSHRRMKSILTSSSNSSPKPSTVPHATSTR